METRPIQKRYLPYYRTFMGDNGTPRAVFAAGGWWRTKDIAERFGPTFDPAKIRDMARDGIVEINDNEGHNWKLYRLMAEYDPRRPAPPPKPAAIQGVLI